MNLCQAFMSKDGSAAIRLTSEEPVRGKFIVSSAFAAMLRLFLFFLSLFLACSLAAADGRRGEREVAFSHKFISAVKRERAK